MWILLPIYGIQWRQWLGPEHLAWILEWAEIRTERTRLYMILRKGRETVQR